MDLHQSVLIFFTQQMVVVGVECKSHNSSCSKMSRAEQSWSAVAELVNKLEIFKCETCVHMLKSGAEIKNIVACFFL